MKSNNFSYFIVRHLFWHSRAFFSPDLPCFLFLVVIIVERDELVSGIKVYYSDPVYVFILYHRLNEEKHHLVFLYTFPLLKDFSAQPYEHLLRRNVPI